MGTRFGVVLETHSNRPRVSSDYLCLGARLFGSSLFGRNAAIAVHHHRGEESYGVPHGPCPHLVPRTVHRLVLTSILLAAKATRGDEHEQSSSDHEELTRAFDISPQSLTTMERWMLTALGELGTWVDRGRVYDLWNVWQRVFGRLFAPTTTLGIGVPPQRPAVWAAAPDTDSEEDEVVEEEIISSPSSSSHRQVVRIQRRTRTVVHPPPNEENDGHNYHHHQ